MFIIRNILVDVADKHELNYHIAQKFNLKIDQVQVVEIIRRSIDARKRGRLKFNYTTLCELIGKFRPNPEIMEYKPKLAKLLFEKKLDSDHPFIIGAGPAGLFAALALVEQGFAPYIFDRGDTISERNKKVEEFWETGKLDTESNVQFGEGGAGTFSDGKLTSRGKDPYTSQVFDKLVEFGAEKDIKVNALPHLGTDGVRIITTNIRTYLESKGCKFHFRSKLTDLEIVDNKLSRVAINDEWFEPEICILAIGNGARDTYEMLVTKINMESKSFAIGFRIEHSQDFINDSFYGKNANIKMLGAATYRLTAKHDNKGIYSFCMCPGGEVIASSSATGQIVTNGMSFSGRDSFYSNSAVVTSVGVEDFGKGILDGMNFQKKIEELCFNPAKPYYAPAQKADHFMKKIKSEKPVFSSYRPMTYNADLNDIFSKPVYSALKTGLAKFDKTAPGFIENGVLIAPETRTSSPVRMLRDRETFEAIGTSSIYPIGEGSGYAGGIMSSAVDGYKLGKTFKR